MNRITTWSSGQSVRNSDFCCHCGHFVASRPEFPELRNRGRCGLSVVLTRLDPVIACEHPMMERWHATGVVALVKSRAADGSAQGPDAMRAWRRRGDLGRLGQMTERSIRVATNSNRSSTIDRRRLLS